MVSNLKGGLNINFAIPITYLNSLIKNSGSLVPLSRIEPTKAEAIESIAINNEPPIINDEGKLTDICCPFGVQLGQKLNSELIDKKILVEEELKELSIEQLNALLSKKEWSPLNRRAIKFVLEYKEQLKFMLALYPDSNESSLTTGWNPRMDSLEKFKTTKEEDFYRWVEIITTPSYGRKDPPDSFFSHDFVPKNPYEGFDIYKAYLVDDDSFVYRIIAIGAFKSCDKEKNILADIIKNKYTITGSSQIHGTVRLYNGNNKEIMISCDHGGDLWLIYEDSELESLKDMIYMKKLRSQRNSSGI